MWELRFRIWDCEIGNPPEGWESEGQLRIFQTEKYGKSGKGICLFWLGTLSRFSRLSSLSRRLHLFTVHRLPFTV
jgi:hypothetical protein